MLIVATKIYGLLIVCTKGGHRIFATDRWPTGLSIEDVLDSLCGCRGEDKHWVYHEQGTEWLTMGLDICTQFDRKNLGAMAMMNHAELPDSTSVGRMAAGSIGVTLIEKAFSVSHSVARRLVRLNMLGEAAEND